MLTILLILVSTAATSTAGATNGKVSDGAPEILRAMIGGHHLSRRNARNRVVPEAMMSLLAAQNEQKSEAKVPLKLQARGAAAIRSFTHKDRDELAFPLQMNGDTHTLLWFNLTDVPATEKLLASELELHRDALGAVSRHHRIYVHVHDIVRKSPLVTRIIDTRITSTKSSGKISLDVQPAVQRWLDDAASNHGLLVELSSTNTTAAAAHVRLRRSTDDDSLWHQQRPLLMTFMSDARERPARARRRANARRKNPKRNCRRHRMYVDFAQVGWDDWIVAPSGYEAYYCHGDCSFPLADHLNATNHAIVQTLQNSADPRVVPKPCCVPTELGPISMLYTDSDDKTVLKVYHDMVVIGCGCR